jgi:hypothetical protein
LEYSQTPPVVELLHAPAPNVDALKVVACLWLEAEEDRSNYGRTGIDVEAFEDGYLAAIITAEGKRTSSCGTHRLPCPIETTPFIALQAYAESFSGRSVSPLAVIAEQRLRTQTAPTQAVNCSLRTATTTSVGRDRSGL